MIDLRDKIPLPIVAWVETRRWGWELCLLYQLGDGGQGDDGRGQGAVREAAPRPANTASAASVMAPPTAKLRGS